jgi:hypothetical protein
MFQEEIERERETRGEERRRERERERERAGAERRCNNQTQRCSRFSLCVTLLIVQEDLDRIANLLPEAAR